MFLHELSARVRSVTLAGLAVALLAGGVAHASTVYVNGSTGNDAWDGHCAVWDGGTCGPKQTIQAGIGAALDGDEVVIADGTYTGTENRNLWLGGKAITVRGAAGDPALCVIDCEHTGFSAFVLEAQEGPDTVVADLTIQHSDNCAVRCRNSSPTFTNCTIRDNRNPYPVYGGGAGVYCYGGSPTFTFCTISGNHAGSPYGDGGGVYVETDGNATFANCTITANYTNEQGGGVYGYGATFVDCTIGENWASWGGGVAGHGEFVRCTINNNVANYGGGVSCLAASFTNCTIAGNRATSTVETFGGGVLARGDATFTGCKIIANQADNGGGLACQDFARPMLINCTIAGNQAMVDGGAVWSHDLPTGYYATLTNCILWGDTSPEISYDTSDPPVVSYCNIQNQSWWPGPENSTAPPGFVDADGPDNDPNTWADNDYHLKNAWASCADSGDNLAVPPDLLHDLDGLPRISDADEDTFAIVDRGAYERPAPLLGDLNCDGAVSFADINPFVDRLLSPDTYRQRHPGCIVENGDLNGDGAVGFEDINPFVELLTTNTLPILCPQ